MLMRRLTAWSVVSLLALVAGCGSRPHAPPAGPKPAPLPAWVTETASGPSLIPVLDRIIEPYGLESSD